MVDIEKEQATLDTFTDVFQSLMIASLTNKGEAYASYAPFVKVDDTYYFIISKIAKHYQNILNHPQITIFFLEDESSASNVFFRKRLAYDVKAQFDESEDIKHAFITKFGEFVKRLFMMDFMIVKTDIIKGHMVVGPGQAFEINQHQQINHQMTGRGGKGHSAKQQSGE